MLSVSAIKLNHLKKKVAKCREKREQGQTEAEHEIAALKELATFYNKHQDDAKLPYAEHYALEYFRAAASLDDPDAQYTVGKRLLDLGIFWTEWFQGPYGEEIHSKYANNYFYEAFQYLKAAENAGMPLAKRLRGLGFVNGWGVAQDKDTGYQLIFESIDEENNWDNVKDICKEWDIDSQEFFKKIHAMKKSEE